MIRFESTQKVQRRIENKVEVEAVPNIMFRSIAFNTLRAASTPGAVRAAIAGSSSSSSQAPVLLMLEKVAAVARYRYNNAATHADRRYMSGGSLYAVDAPNGDHDLQDIVRGISFSCFWNTEHCFIVISSSYCIYSLRSNVF